MNTIIYDTHRIFFPTSSSNGPTSADKVSIKINSESEIGEAKNVQEAIQMMTNGLDGLVEDLPQNLNIESETISLNDVARCVNNILNAFRQNVKEENNE
jgi:hypothetical protein